MRIKLGERVEERSHVRLEEEAGRTLGSKYFRLEKQTVQLFFSFELALQELVVQILQDVNIKDVNGHRLPTCPWAQTR